ncbi:glycosyl transferase family 1 [Roseovarius atlanticus]|uniref:Glycosyl transferase family 1 n=1 Tax=Roseovarius atlanticus TaxID=1641875 RepID=A0A0T5NSH7_9RHOB|nr:glycosyltransferase family 4 protein [Roseovarius atlanticus]KRS11896.1 glycosyl transferase family 1 [Roseovarius atlanticus]
MTRTKLAYLTGEYPRASDTFIQREIAALRELGHDVLTCSVRTTGAEHLVGPEQRDEHARTFKLLESCKKPLTVLRAHLHWLRWPARYLSALALAWQAAPAGLKGRTYNLIYFIEAGVLAQHLAEQNVAHLHNHIAKSSCTVAMLASKLSGIPYSFAIHGPDIFFEPIHWRIDKKAEHARFVACISEFCRSQLMCFADAAHWTKFHIVHCGIEPGRYRASPHEGQRLLFVGRLAGVKGVPVLLEALAGVSDRPDWHLDLIGDGPERKAIEARARALNLSDRVTFHGYRSQADVAEALGRTDLFVLPSFAEGLPVVLMEALAAAVPVVTTRIAGVSELVADGESGLLVPPGDAEALRWAITKLLDDPERRRRMGEAGRVKVAEAFDIRNEAAWLSALVEGYAADSPPTTKRPGAGGDAP